ncbi:hypothetical protein N7495_009881 [Penicillium taxi]|uniref:uncharacterized protein n=1 Tax=Penicillium taxi TaxID=168475 RepID=UPI00254506B6|nr:uncharacterized protein N7495_009881 [Penicillium taxi]KAJ5885371.1 hypothetical protein N7495_009881 [Penicillium taxi]
MGRAEAGSTKAIGNKIKSKGLGRLRWYCQACERQMRDANGFKCHTQSPAHVRQMLLIGEDPRKHIQEFSDDFLKTFVETLRTTHGEKQVQINHFYQQIIAHKEHIHMNSTKWQSLTQFASYLGKEGICRVEETEKGLFISWIDNSPETMRKREAIMKKERQDKGDEEREQKMIKDQIERARRREAEKKANVEEDGSPKLLQRNGQKFTMKLGGINVSGQAKLDAEAPSPSQVDLAPIKEGSTFADTPAPTQAAPAAPMKFSMKTNNAPRPGNVFAKKSNPLVAKKVAHTSPSHQMTEIERIMKSEISAKERKRNRPDIDYESSKRHRS